MPALQQQAVVYIIFARGQACINGNSVEATEHYDHGILIINLIKASVFILVPFGAHHDDHNVNDSFS